jgi:hypothetical protein
VVTGAGLADELDDEPPEEDDPLEVDLPDDDVSPDADEPEELDGPLDELSEDVPVEPVVLAVATAAARLAAAALLAAAAFLAAAVPVAEAGELALAPVVVGWVVVAPSAGS